jgi:hypothetical protein
MLIFASASQHAAAASRIVDTLVGTGAGLAGGLLFAPPRVQPAREAVGELAGRLAGLLDEMAADLAGPPGARPPGARTPGTAAPGARPLDSARATDWLNQSRDLRGEIERVDDMLRQAEDSVRLNPRSLRMPDALPATEVALRGGLETLEHAAVTLRGLARSVLDSTRLTSDASPVRDERTRDRLASVLAELSEAIRTYGRLMQTLPSGNEPLESELSAHLAEAHRQQDLLAAMLEPRTAPEGRNSEWPLRGEILSHVDRLRTGLRVDAANAARGSRRVPRVHRVLADRPGNLDHDQGRPARHVGHHSSGGIGRAGAGARRTPVERQPAAGHDADALGMADDRAVVADQDQR